MLTLSAQMLGVSNSQERTITEFRDLLAAADWELVSVLKPSASRIANPLLIAVPAPVRPRRFTSYPGDGRWR